MNRKSNFDQKHYLAVVFVQFKSPIDIVDKASGARTSSDGYFIKLGLSPSPGESIQQAITSLIDEGEIVWRESTIEEIEWAEMDDELRANSDGFGVKRLWFRGSEFYFPAGSD